MPFGNKRVEAAAHAAYNGLCLEAENGETEAWECKGVDAPRHLPECSIIDVHLRPYGRLRIRIEEVE